MKKRGAYVAGMAVGLGLGLGACREAPPAREPEAAQAGVVDSVFPMEVMLERFRAGVERPAALTSGAESRDALVRAVVDALAANDTIAFERLALSLPEFAWLYFPTTAEAQPPYEVPPALSWFQTQERNRIGVTRALRELGGKELDFRGYRCDPEPSIEGENRVWRKCLVRIPRPGKPEEFPLFSAIVERDGRFAIVSYANDF